MPSATLEGSNDVERLASLCSRTYKEQAIWFLNAFWTDFAEKESETIWNYTFKCHELDLEKKDAGCELDELNAHRLLEKFHETMTVRDMREGLRSKGALEAKAKSVGFMIPLVHWLIMKYDVDFHVLLNAPQGNQEEVDEAQRRLEVAQAALSKAQEAAKEARAREAEAKKREAEAIAAETEAKAREVEAKAAAEKAREADESAKQAAAAARAREEEQRAAQAELEAALAELKAQEDAYAAKTAELTAKSEGGGVAALRAKNELAQHLGEDPLPLRRAKINQEAAVRKADKATQAAAEARASADAAAQKAAEARQQAEEAAAQATAAREAAEEARRQAVAAREAAESAARAAEEALQEAQQAFQEAEEYLEEVKNSIGYGSSWWIDRELHEAKKYLPLSKGGIARA